jgi:hypothetical protein
MFKPYFVQVFIEDNSLFGINFIGPTDFFYTFSGTILIHIMFVVRDILIMLVKIVLNIILVVLITRYITKLKNEKKEFALRISTNLYNCNIGIAPVSNKTSYYLTKTARNQTYLAIIMCVFSVIKHLFYIASYILKFFINDNLLAFYIYYIFLLSISIECLSNIFVFYKLNNLFKRECKKFVNNLKN